MSYALDIVDKALGSDLPTTLIFPCRMSAMQYASKSYAPKGEPLLWKIQPDDSYLSSTETMSFKISKSDKEVAPCGQCRVKNAQTLLTISKDGVQYR